MEVLRVQEMRERDQLDHLRAKCAMLERKCEELETRRPKEVLTAFVVGLVGSAIICFLSIMVLR